MTQLASLADDDGDESASVVRVSQEEITLLEEMVTGAPAKDFAVGTSERAGAATEINSGREVASSIAHALSIYAHREKEREKWRRTREQEF